MHNDRIYLTPQEILNKEFKVDARGYRPQEVDKFLDMIIRDYTEFVSVIKTQDKNIKDLIDDNNKLKQEIRELRIKLSTAEETTSEARSGSVSNVDLLRRISRLEKAVFRKE